MPYTVDWTDEALDELAEIWMDASDPDAVTRAQSVLDYGLARHPDRCGVELSEGLRVWQVDPLRIYFEIDTQVRKVSVNNVFRPIA